MPLLGRCGDSYILAVKEANPAEGEGTRLQVFLDGWKMTGTLRNWNAGRAELQFRT